MRYPCAYEGVRKIRIAAIITVAVTVIAIITDLIGVFASESLDNWNYTIGEIPPAAVVVVILALPMTILSLVGMVIRIIGVRKALQEEPEFDSAFWMIFIQIVVSVIDGFIPDDCKEAKLFMSVAIDILGLLAAIFIIKGIRALAGFLENNEVADEAFRIRNVFVIAYAIGITSRVIANIMSKPDSFVFVSGIGGLIGSIILLASYLYYLKFLKKAEAMLGYDLYMTSDTEQ